MHNMESESDKTKGTENGSWMDEVDREWVAGVNEVQKEVVAWALKNFGEQQAYRPLLGAVEELGELCHSQLKMEQGIRGGEAEHKAKAADAVGDIIVYLMAYCEEIGIELGSSLKVVWDEVQLRDWKVNPIDGRI